MEEKEKVSIGDIKPIYQITGFEVVKRMTPEGEPVVVAVESQFEAEVLSAVYKQEKGD